MTNFLINNDLTYKIVINDEEQYSIWPLYKDAPLGWKNEGFQGSHQDCLNYIDKIWLDLTPKSLRTIS